MEQQPIHTFKIKGFVCHIQYCNIGSFLTVGLGHIWHKVKVTLLYTICTKVYRNTDLCYIFPLMRYQREVTTTWSTYTQHLNITSIVFMATQQGSLCSASDACGKILDRSVSKCFSYSQTNKIIQQETLIFLLLEKFQTAVLSPPPTSCKVLTH